MPEPRPPAPTAIGEAAPADGYGALLCDAYASGPRPGTHLQVIERDDGETDAMTLNCLCEQSPRGGVYGFGQIKVAHRFSVQ